MEKSTKKQVILIAVLSVILVVLLVLNVLEINSKINNGPEDMEPPKLMDEEGGDATLDTDVVNIGENEITDNQKLNDVSYKSSKKDTAAVLVKDNGTLELTDSSISKTGDVTNIEDSEFYGVNSGVLAYVNATIMLNNSTVKTDAKGANAVFAVGENATIYVNDTKIETKKDGSRGLDSTYGGKITASNVTISTKGESSAALATDRGEGTVTAKNSNLTTAGKGSPVIYSTGNISLTDSKGTANGAQMVIVEGKNSATVKNSTLVCSADGNRGKVDSCGVMIYQSMSGDASTGEGTFTVTDSSLTIDSKSDNYKTAPLFFSTNTDGIFNLTNTKLKFGSNILLKAVATSEWGTEGMNGSNVTMNATNQFLKGDVVVDNSSTVKLNLTDNSSYEGTINAENTGKTVIVSLDETSTLKLTGDTYLSELKNTDTKNTNIDFNGYKLYVAGAAIN